jgi:hypothetical protein
LISAEEGEKKEIKIPKTNSGQRNSFPFSFSPLIYGLLQHSARHSLAFLESTLLAQKENASHFASVNL